MMVESPLSSYCFNSVEKGKEQNEQALKLRDDNNEISLCNATTEYSAWILDNLTPDICENLACQPCNTIAEASSYLTRNYVTMMICHKQVGAVGVCGYQKLIGRDVELFYWIAKDHRGKHFAYEALKQLIAQAATDVNAVVAEIFDTNKASISLAEKLGFECVQFGSVNKKKTRIYRKCL